MFQFPGLASLRMTGLQPAELSHSEIFGLTRICQYPKLIAAYHVLHRLQEPRHPPHTLKYFLVFFEYHSSPETFMMLCLILFNFHLPLCQTQIPMNLSFYLLSQYVKELLTTPNGLSKWFIKSPSRS